jgi:hypothetical protein
MTVARRIRGAGVRKPPKEETAGGVMKLRVRRYGDLDAGGLLPGCVDRLSGKQSTGRRALGQSRRAEPASRSRGRTTGRLLRAARG